MAICAKTVETVDGSLLALDPSETNVGACQYVLHTGIEWLNGSVATMSPSDAATLAGYVCLLWATAWGIKVLVRSLFLGEANESQND